MVAENRDMVVYLRDAHDRGDYSKEIGSLDYALSRFNTILLRLTEHPLLSEQYVDEILSCHTIIRSFYFGIVGLNSSSKITKYYYQFKLYVIGRLQLPKIKKLLNRVELDIAK